MEPDVHPSDLTGDYTIDPAHSRFGFTARYAMVTKVRGSIPLKEALVHLDAANPGASSARMTLDVAGIETGNGMRDDHLRTGDFLDVAKYPHITFVSTDVKHVGGDSFEVTGDLTIRDVTTKITIPLDYTGTSVDAQSVTRVGFEGGLAINRSDYGITTNAVLETGGVMISDKITLDFDLSLIKNA
ncbi:polyisoprenoid-binding protein [Nonomuraea terrae]|uniref:Polyisoprenoid-binding protein n=1 Tax=Nonomuraea terrae TaxID=2530383 RepID=A0A4R4YIP9_9ACTN|nr:polyisoprenoid-binding protein [Nonomuraea terrae]